MDKESYGKYLESNEWKAKRKEALKRAENRCQVCNAKADTKPLEVHHRTYERVGKEIPGDLTVLCWHCHHLISIGPLDSHGLSCQADQLDHLVQLVEDSLESFAREDNRHSLDNALTALRECRDERDIGGVAGPLAYMFSHLRGSIERKGKVQ